MRENSLRVKKNARFSLLKWICIVVPVGLCCILTGVNIYQGFFLKNLFKEITSMINKAEVLDSEALKNLAVLSNNAEMSNLIETGIAIISIAVTIWIGLNIYNVLSKEEVEEKINSFSKSFDELVDNQKKALHNLEKSKEELQRIQKKNYFIDMLRYSAEKYYGSKFFMCLIDEKVNEFSDIDKLINLEKQYYECCNKYEKNNFEKVQEIVWELISGYSALKDKCKTDDTIMKNFILMRYSDVLFYEYVSVERTSGIHCDAQAKRFEESIEIYKEILENMKDLIQSDKEMEGYIYNTIGYSYHLLSKYYRDIREKYIRKSIKYMSKAVADCKNNGRYQRNAGLPYEAIKKYRKAKKHYNAAIKCDQRDFKTYNTLMSIEMKIIERDFGIGRRQDILCNMKLDSIPMSIIDKVINLGEIALSLDYFFVDSHYNLAKGYMYKYLGEGKKDRAWIDKALGQVEKALELNPSSLGALFTERNIYEALGEIEKALMVAEKIGQKGDNPKMKGIYETHVKLQK